MSFTGNKRNIVKSFIKRFEKYANLLYLTLMKHLPGKKVTDKTHYHNIQILEHKL